jgi:hypothetical protein
MNQHQFFLYDSWFTISQFHQNQLRLIINKLGIFVSWIKKTALLNNMHKQFQITWKVVSWRIVVWMNMMRSRNEVQNCICRDQGDFQNLLVLGFCISFAWWSLIIHKLLWRMMNMEEIRPVMFSLLFRKESLLHATSRIVFVMDDGF